MKSFIILSIVFCAVLHAQCASQHKVFWRSNELDVYAIDNVFGKSSKMLRDVKSQLKDRNWEFIVDRTTSQDDPVKMGFKTKTTGDLTRTKAVKTMHKLAKDLYGDKAQHLVGLQGRIIERGDFDPVITVCSENASRIRGLVVLTSKWKKNNYGEISVYDKNGEILKSLHPRHGRTVFLPCDVHFKISPPSVNVEERHYFLITEFGKDSETRKASVEDDESIFEEPSLARFLKENIKDDMTSYENINVKSCVTRNFTTGKGRKIFIFDNAIPHVIVDAMRHFIVNHADYHESPVVEEDSADNVKWIISLDEPDIQESTLWHIVKQLLFHVSAKEFFPYDLSCNHIRRTDTTFKHRDTYDNLGIYTVLVYLNSNWTENNYGETTFSENNEIIAAVRPRYGRVVIFDGRINHSAHPSSPELSGARYTFAFKTAPGIEAAMTKLFENDGLKYKDVHKKMTEMKNNGNKEAQAFATDILEKMSNGKVGPSDVSRISEYVSRSEKRSRYGA